MNQEKVIVFGGSGFLGSHVADELTKRGYQVVVFDLKKSPYIKDGQTMVLGNITDQNLVEKAMEGCQIVYNFAAIADLEKAKAQPIETVKSNILGNAILLEASRKNNIKRFVFASTLYVYSNSGSFYRSSKQSSELLIESYNEVYGLPYTILRYGSLYGPRAGEDNWIQRALKQAILTGKIVRLGNGEEMREYIHVYDAARLSCNILSQEYQNQHVIITGNQQMKVKHALALIKELMGNKIELEFATQNNLYGHYEFTPYNFSPKIAKRIVGTHYVDFGQGILDLLSQLYQEHSPHRKKDGLYTET